MTLDIKQRLKAVAQSRSRTLTGEPLDIFKLCAEALAEIERLEAGPCHQVCVHLPIGGYPHEPGCIGCRIEKHCYKCGHFVDLWSKHW